MSLSSPIPRSQASQLDQCPLVITTKICEEGVWKSVQVQQAQQPRSHAHGAVTISGPGSPRDKNRGTEALRVSFTNRWPRVVGKAHGIPTRGLWRRKYGVTNQPLIGAGRRKTSFNSSRKRRVRMTLRRVGQVLNPVAISQSGAAQTIGRSDALRHGIYS